MNDKVGLLAIELRGHASSLTGIAEQLDRAVDAAKQVSTPVGAYGVICQFFPPMLDPVEQVGVDALASCAKSMRSTVDRLRATVDEYEQTDSANAAKLHGRRL